MHRKKTRSKAGHGQKNVEKHCSTLLEITDIQWSQLAVDFRLFTQQVIDLVELSYTGFSNGKNQTWLYMLDKFIDNVSQ